MPSLNNSKTYRKFIKDRDLALENILNNTMIRVDNDLKVLFTAWVKMCIHATEKSKVKLDDIDDLRILKSLQNNMEIVSHHTTAMVSHRIKDMRRKVYILTIASEAEAIGRATNKQTKYIAGQGKLDQVTNKPSSYNMIKWEPRIRYHLLALIDKLKKTTHWLLMNPDFDTAKIPSLLISKLPRTVNLQKMKPALKKIKATEAKKKWNPEEYPPDDVEFSSGYFSDDDWAAIAEDIATSYPVDRGPEAIIGETEEGEAHYAWQLEQEMTHDFVVAVRDGQVDAATQNGIIDFVWIAILDDTTCENCCGGYGCADFDGMLTSEVEMVTKGEVINPPAHFNCRCSLSPVTDDIPTAETNLGDFEAWLNT